MARDARGVTCRECGCLNFSSEHEVCDKCRSKTLAFRPTARRLATGSASSSRRHDDSDRQAHSISKKRRYEETKNTSNNKNEDKHKRDRKQERPTPPAAKKQPDVIDLISDDEGEDDVVVQKVIRESLKTVRQGEKEEQKEDNEPRELFQSRVFPSVTFVESDFPTMEVGALMRKRAVDQGLLHSQPTGGRAAMAAGKNGQEKASKSVSQPTPKVSRAVDPKPAEPRPPPIVVNGDEEEKKENEAATVTPEKKTEEKVEEKELTKIPGEKGSTTAVPADTTAADVVRKDATPAEENAANSDEVDPLFQSRMFDSIEFKASDFAMVFDGLVVARRSHPPASSSSNTATSTSVEPGATAPTVSAAPPKTNEVRGLATVASSITTPAPSSTTTKTTSEAKIAPSTTESAAPKVATTPATAANTSTSRPSASVPQPVSNAPAASAVTATASAKPTPKSAALIPPTKAASNHSIPAAATPSTKVASAPSQASSAPSATANPVVTTVVPPKSSPVPAPVPSNPSSATPASSTMKPTSTADTAEKPAATSSATTSVYDSVTSSAPTVVSSAATISDQSRANGDANVLLPKKKHSEGVPRTDEEKRHTKPPPIDVSVSGDADGVEFVKVNAAPREVLPVEPPTLGYCSPEFLAFMRECGDEDGDEEDDPDEVSRSQLKRLDVVDLTNLSDSEDSEAESPLPTPRDGATQQRLAANGQAAAVGQPVAAANVNASGTGTWYAPTLDSDRKRTQPEKVMCELCEEKGSPYRLIRCPTCTKYYHKKCAKENGDENICWNCELGSMIDDTELDEEHAKHNSEYLAYLKAIRRSSSPEDGEGEEEEEYDDNEGQEGEDVPADDVEIESLAEGEEDSNPFSEEGNAKRAGKRWMEFIGGATADIDATYHEVTNRIAEELRDEEKKQLYSRGFVSRDEFEAQMTEVEEYYISEEARLQQLEREKAIEAKKAAEARKAAADGEQHAGTSAIEPDATSVSTPTLPESSTAGGVANIAVPPPSTTTTVTPPATVSNTAATSTTTPVAVPTPMSSTTPHPAAPTAARTAVPAPMFVPAVGVPTAAFATAFRTALSRSAPPPASKP